VGVKVDHLEGSAGVEGVQEGCFEVWSAVSLDEVAGFG
jgi:hypothetical protein